MKSRMPIFLALAILPLLVLLLLANASLQAEPAEPAAVISGSPIAIDISILGDPASLDPSLASDVQSLNIVEQLFAGLVTQDERNGAILPELASHWDVSADSTVYTFTLRSDATWSDGRALTAGDARYGILRSLDPATNAPYAYVLYLIENAQAYNEGGVGAEQVGVDVLNDTTLRLRLEEPAGHFLSVLSMWPARPMPSWAIDAYGAGWTDPDNIVTSGAYALAEYVTGDHLVLSKSLAYHGADGVQIEQVNVAIVSDGDAAWQMYLDGDLDTVEVPADVTIPPEIAGEITKQPRPCTYYYGFSQIQPPFDNVLVRRAFSAATDRQAVVDLTNGGQAPAVTFAARGVFGYVDGYAEGIGHPYNPTQAQQYLSDAGYPGGAGLPSITLWYNDSAGHQAIAEVVRDSWQTALGVTVALESRPWTEFFGLVSSGSLQVYRMGWCADYLDAYNFLNDAIFNRDRLGGWSNAAYENIIDQSRIETNPSARETLFKQAEEILVEDDAVLIPLYFYGSHIASKPHLIRTYPASTYHIAFWRIQTSASIDTGGGSLSSYDGQIQITMPAGAVSETVEMTHAPLSGPPSSGDKVIAGQAFSLTAVYSDTGQPAAPQSAYQIVIHYDNAGKGTAIESTLALYSWDGAAWQKEPSSVVDTGANTVTAAPDHFSIWAVLGETYRNYAPLVVK